MASLQTITVAARRVAAQQGFASDDEVVDAILSELRENWDPSPVFSEYERQYALNAYMRRRSEIRGGDGASGE